MICGTCKARDVDIAHVRSHLSGDGPTRPSLAAAPPVGPWKRGDALPFPAGRYAILVREGGPNDMEVRGTEDGLITKFYKVDAPEDGRWKGYVFVSVQASDEFHRIRNMEQVASIINTISMQGWKESLLRYGREIGVCGHCGRTLTNEESRAYGIGPICRRDPRLAI